MLNQGIELSCSTKVLPTAMATGGDIGLSNMSLKIITLSLYSECQDDGDVLTCLSHGEVLGTALCPPLRIPLPH